jgi:hypothetical protein
MSESSIELSRVKLSFESSVERTGEVMVAVSAASSAQVERRE